MRLVGELHRRPVVCTFRSKGEARGENLMSYQHRLRGLTVFSRERPAFTVGLVILLVYVIWAMIPGVISPFDPYLRIAPSLLPPSSQHLLGTNDVGQDIFSELVFGARVSLFIGFAAALAVISIGTFIGLVSGYLGGVVDEALMRLADVILILPSLPLMILLAAIMGKQNIYNIIIAIAVNAWPGVARLVRSAVLSLKERPFVEATRAAGASRGYIMVQHMLPNVAPLVIAELIGRVASGMLAEAGLSFLGLGDPLHKSWGMMIHYANECGGWWANNGMPAWWWLLPPGLCISMVTTSLSLVGQGMEDLLNPRLRRM